LNVTTDLSLLVLVANASLVVKLVIGVLLLMSLLSWWYIFRKSFVLHDTRNRSEAFERTFWSGPDLNQLFQSIVSGQHGSDLRSRLP
jgi:biopolymer transport protein TolQ